ncbi:MAG TPA: hypothetical protein VNL71_06900 [Chloroflexota bacterium]|nr:hypothetical protein [Chloroflexota bacterium]
MYARVTPIRFDVSRPDAVTQVSRDVVLPLFRGLPGFQRYQGGLDAAQGTGVSLSFWQTREQAQGLTEAVRPIVAQIQAAGIELGTPAIYEILVEG